MLGGVTAHAVLSLKQKAVFQKPFFPPKKRCYADTASLTGMRGGRTAKQRSCHWERWGQVTGFSGMHSRRKALMQFARGILEIVNKHRESSPCCRNNSAQSKVRSRRVLWHGSSLPEPSHPLLLAHWSRFLSPLCTLCSQGKRGGSIWAEQSWRKILRQSQACSLFINSSWRVQQSLNLVSALPQFMWYRKHIFRKLCVIPWGLK